ncbi:cytochrome c peroxidase [Thiothrix caldifontis]|uniref:Cytochrome c peroxidase n=1 Tax=Thiothrix caldifontis TaxID=525918 RepID=A0A1H3YKC0_9GAMM|nr:cytochrome c peroxidase [Thiothrix caldifontis]SEA11398.1 cytochrome c peroxidase [Thiothrix caldifontis]
MKIQLITFSLVLATLCTACGDGNNASLTNTTVVSKEILGEQLFFDTNLSSPAGQSCASCHDPAHGFADPDTQFPTSEGANAGIFDKRHTPSSAYSLYSPEFHFDANLNEYIGGQFSDGRARNLTIQAQNPFLDPLEMANPNPASVVTKVKNAAYANMMTQIYGAEVFDNVATAYTSIADALAAFERTPLFHPFDSKFDHYLAGKISLTSQEAYGLQLFNDPSKGNCAACHSTAANNGTNPLFTNFRYANIGLPANPAIPVPPDQDSMRISDDGLGGLPDMPSSELGKFKVPTLRNIAKTAPYGHNGVIQDLREMVDFHNTRDVVAGRWALPEVSENLDPRVGNLGLTDSEVEAVVAFLITLNDGYTLPTSSP